MPTITTTTKIFSLKLEKGADRCSKVYQIPPWSSLTFTCLLPQGPYPRCLRLQPPSHSVKVNITVHIAFYEPSCEALQNTLSRNAIVRKWGICISTLTDQTLSSCSLECLHQSGLLRPMFPLFSPVFWGSRSSLRI